MNEFIVWDKTLNCFHFDERVKFEDGVLNPIGKDYTIHQYIGLKDINNKKIYANSSICRVNYFGNHLDLMNVYCYFYFNTEDLRYTVRFINERQIVDYESSSFDSIEIVDTIQENKLRLIK